MISFLKNIFSDSTSTAANLAAVEVDMHSHILPGLDDGAETLDRSMELLREMQAFGYKKLIMTPHIMGDFYRNTPDQIKAALAEVQAAAKANNIAVELACAAEYYLDESLIQKLESREPLLTFGDRYLLFETSYINEPLNLSEAVFMIKAAGYKPVLAHPERYTYFYHRFEDLKALKETGVLFQLNLLSLTGYYSGAAKHVAEKLIKNKMVDFVGSDVHAPKHLRALEKVTRTSAWPKLMDLPLLNSQL